MAIRVGLCFFFLCFFSIGCGQRQLSEAEGRAELKRLHKMAKLGSAEEAVTAGEGALGLISLVTYEKKITPQKRKVAGFESAEEIAKLRESENYTDSGEASFIYEAFDESLRIFQIAHEKNPSNDRANAYLAMLTPIQFLKGAEWRSTALGMSEENLNYDLLSTLSVPESSRTYEDQFGIFLRTPFKEKFKDRKEYVDQLIRPLMEALIASEKYWSALNSNPLLDINLFIPGVMGGLTASRFRVEDASMASSMYLGAALYLKLWTLYDPADLKMNSDEDKDKRALWKTLSQNPSFGVLTDPLFYPLFQNKVFEFTKSMDVATRLLKFRETHSGNSTNDFFQFTPNIIRPCNELKGRERGEGFYYTYWAECPGVKTVVAPSVLTESFGAKTREETSDPIARYKKENSLPPVYTSDFRSMVGEKVKEETDVFTSNNILSDLALLRKLMNGPERVAIYCVDPTGEKKAYGVEAWVDFPHYLKNPIGDIKSLNIEISKDGDLENIGDRSLHGLFPDGFPCIGQRTQGLKSALLR